MVERPAYVREVDGSIPQPGQTKDFEIVLHVAEICLTLRFKKVELESEPVGPVLLYCDWVDYYIMCLGWYFSARQHSKTER